MAIDQIRTVSRPNCLFCKTPGELLYDDLFDTLFDVPGTWRMKRCPNPDCGLLWLDPVAAESDIPLLYRNYYTHRPGPAAGGAAVRLRSLLYGGYKAIVWLPSTVVGLRSAQRKIHFMFLDDLSPGKLLDVGCGDGTFLARMHKRGWTVAGVDFDAKAIEHAKALYNFDVRTTDLPGARFPENHFDAVTMNHVIEHVPDPVVLLTEIRRILKPNGRLVSATPNARAYGHIKFKECWRGLEPPRHLQILTMSSLAECARRAGFTSFDVTSSAANADIIIGASYGVRQFKQERRQQNASTVNVGRAIRSLLLQYAEAVRLRRDPECGEEAVLVCQK